MALCFAVDFDRNDWAALYADPADEPNLFGTTGVDTRDLYRTYAGAGASVAAGTAFARYGDTRAKYGKGPVNFLTGTTSSVNAVIGYNGVTANINNITGTQTAMIWARVISGTPAGDTFRVRWIRSGVGTIATGSSAAITSDWQLFTAGGVADNNAGGKHLAFDRVSGTASLTIELAGAMVVDGTTLPSYLNCGADSLLEPITDYVLNASWNLGFVKPYQYVAPRGNASFKLSNTDKRFSPEYGSSPINSADGYMNKLVQVGDPAYGIWWTGWTDSIRPVPGTRREQTAELKASDARRFMDKTKVFVPLSVGASSETDPFECITDVMALVESPIDASMTGLESGGDFAGFDAGSTAFPAYYFDSGDENADVARILADVLGANQGHFLFNRTGQWMPFESTADNAAVASYDIGASWIDGEYVWGERLINRCEVTVHPKRITSSAATIWRLDESITLAAGESEVFRANFRNNTSDDGHRMIIGANNVAASGWTLVSGTVPTHVTVTLSEVTAQSCLITLANISGVSRTVNAGTLTGNKVIALRTIVMNYEDTSSVLNHGVQCEQLNFDWVSTRIWAKKLAKWMVTRFTNPRGEFRWVTLDGNEQTALLFNCAVTISVSVEDDQTEHSDVYGVIGEAHTVREGMKDHVGKLYLEPMYGTTIEDTTLP